jgi:pyrroline-5-carboxylate reductase
MVVKGKKIGFIGCGNMARAMIAGIIKGELLPAENILVSDPSEAQIKMVTDNYPVTVKNGNNDVSQEADYLFLAVKPYLYGLVMNEIKDSLKKDCIVISIAAGINFDMITDVLGKEVKLVRSQPSTPAFVLESDSGISVNPLMDDDDTEEVMKIFRSFGKVELVKENLMDAVTGIASSSPAYVFVMIEAMADGGVLHGIPREQAYRLAAQAVYGAAKMVLESGEHPGKLKDQVCTPGGTTIEAIKTLEELGFRNTLISAMDACINKSKSFAKN